MNKPGNVNSIDRVPPPIDSFPSSTSTESFARAMVTAAASLGPDPTTTASNSACFAEGHPFYGELILGHIRRSLSSCPSFRYFGAGLVFLASNEGFVTRRGAAETIYGNLLGPDGQIECWGIGEAASLS